VKDGEDDEPDLFGFRSATYPETPGYKEETTSRDAAEAIAPRAGTLRAMALEALAGGWELTPDEIAEKVGKSVLAIRPRCTELDEMGFIERTGRRRMNDSGLYAHVYRLRCR